VSPPSPTYLALGDNTPSLSWFDHHSTASAMGQNQIQLSAEYLLDANVKSSGKHLKGTLNTIADEISRPHERFIPHLTKIHDIPFSTLVKQVCQKHPILQSYRIFLLSPDIFSALSSSLSKMRNGSVHKSLRKTDGLYPLLRHLSRLQWREGSEFYY
jgi:hypothetical protein